MRIATIAQMMLTMTDMFPVTFSNPKLVESWEPQYRATLSKLEGDDLNNCWHACLDGWTKKAAPSPADFLKAFHATHQGRKSGSTGEGSLADRLAKRDNDLRDLCRDLQAEWESNHPKVVASASAEGWISNLRHQLLTGARMLAQRNLLRKEGRNPRSLDTDDQAYYGIYAFEGGAEQLTITQAMIDLWRSYQAEPDTRSPPSKSSTFKRAEA